MKNFTNNFKQFTSRLSARWLIMALMLLLGTSSAWAATVNGVIYFEKPNANWGTPVLCLGKSDGSQMNFTMELHCGNIYKKQVTWGDGNATCIAFTDCTGSWGWERNSLEHRLNYISGNGTYKYDISSNPAGKIFKPGTTNNSVNNGNGNLYVWDGGFVQAFSESLCCTPPTLSFDNSSIMVTSGTVVNLNEASGAEITSGTGNIVWYSDSGCADVVSDPTNVTYTGSSDKYYYAKAVGDCSSDPKSFMISACYASYDGSTYLYFDIKGSYFSDASAVPNVSFDGGSSYMDAVVYDAPNKIYRLLVPEGCYKTMNVRRHGSSYWNLCSNIDLSEKGDNNTFIVGDNWNNCEHSWGKTQECTTPDFYVRLSNATVTKGDANIKASVAGTHSPAVRWSSSDEEVATIDASGNITAHKGGQTTITATTTGDGGFCENVPKPATLTVKENPTVTINADKNPICSGEEATLTANISNLSVGIIPTVSWYKKGENGVKHTGTTYNPTTSGEYYVIVTGNYINEVSLEEEPLQFTINQTPTLESTLENNNTNVEICGSGNATLSVTPGFVSYSWGDGNTKTVNATGKYTVTATDAKSCTSNEVEFNVKVLNPTVTLVGDEDQIVCPGANANFEVVLTNVQSVSWKDAERTEVSTSNPFTPQIEGEAGTTYTYIVVVSEGSCSSEEETVTAMVRSDAPQIYAPMISISQGTICEDGSATITVNNPIEDLTYTLYKETEPIGTPVNYQTGDLTFNVTEAGSYTVRAEESICNNYENSMPVELKVVTSDVKIGLAVDKTTVNPWQPLKLTVTPPEGYAYSIDGLADVVYTQSGDVYTIKIPRPNDWSPGNSGDPVKTKPITFSAKIQVTDDLTCGTSSVNVTLADTEENCK